MDKEVDAHLTLQQKYVKELSEDEKSKGLSRFSLEEQKLRIELAAAYRYFAFKQWDEALVYNHITVRVPSSDPSVHHFLINPFGLSFEEVTASSLIKVDIEGNIVDPGDSGREVFVPGFIIHSAIHKHREDLQCIAHTHETSGSAVSAMKFGLLPVHQNVHMLGEVAYHEYEGLAFNEAERDRLVEDLGTKSCMILRNHGLLTAGRSIAEAVAKMYFFVRSCEIQVAALSAGYDNLYLPSKESTDYNKKITDALYNSNKFGVPEFEAIVRKMERLDPSFKL